MKWAKNILSLLTSCVHCEICEWQFSPFIVILSEKRLNLRVISREIANLCGSGMNTNSRHKLKVKRASVKYWKLLFRVNFPWIWIHWLITCKYQGLRNSIRLICHFNWLLRSPTHTKKNYLSITFHSHKYFIDRCMSLIFASFHTKVIYGHTLWIIACKEGIFASAQCPRKNG